MFLASATKPPSSINITMYMQLMTVHFFRLAAISRAWLAERSANQLSPRSTIISLVWMSFPGMKATDPNGTWEMFTVLVQISSKSRERCLLKTIIIHAILRLGKNSVCKLPAKKKFIETVLILTMFWSFFLVPNYDSVHS